MGSSYMQFIPLVERCRENGLTQPQDKHIEMMPWSVDSLQFGQFLNAIFDVWICEDTGIQLFEQTLVARCSLPPQVCVFAPPAAARL